MNRQRFQEWRSVQSQVLTNPSGYLGNNSFIDCFIGMTQDYWAIGTQKIDILITVYVKYTRTFGTVDNCGYSVTPRNPKMISVFFNTAFGVKPFHHPTPHTRITTILFSGLFHMLELPHSPLLRCCQYLNSGHAECG